MAILLLAEDGSVETPDGYPVLQLTDGKFWANNHTHILRGTKRTLKAFWADGAPYQDA